MANRPGRKRINFDHDSIVEDWNRNAESHNDANFDFLHSLKWRNYRFKPDQAAAQLHRKAFEILDCTRCANCCKTLAVYLNEGDIERISAHLGVTRDEFIATYLTPPDEDGDYKIRVQPCTFLGDDNRCTIYDVRPAVCRDYPNTHKTGFASRTYSHSANTLTCPAVYWIVEQLRRRASSRRS